VRSKTDNGYGYRGTTSKAWKKMEWGLSWKARDNKETMGDYKPI
jgi:hypothetical protein